MKARSIQKVTPKDALKSYVAGVRRTQQTGHNTPEQSFYPALVGFLEALGGSLDPTLTATSVISVPGLSRFPDVGLIEVASRVLAVPVEVKPANTNLDTLLRSS